MVLFLILLMKVWGWGNVISVENLVYVVVGLFLVFFMLDKVY